MNVTMVTQWITNTKWQAAGQVLGKSFEAILSNFIINPFKTKFTIIMFIHYKPRIAVAINDL